MTSVWIAVGIYVWINHEPIVQVDTSPIVKTKEQCEIVVAAQKEIIDANSDVIGYALVCIEMDVEAKGVPLPASTPQPFELNHHTPGSDFWGKLFHDAGFKEENGLG